MFIIINKNILKFPQFLYQLYIPLSKIFFSFFSNKLFNLCQHPKLLKNNFSGLSAIVDSFVYYACFKIFKKNIYVENVVNLS